MLLPFFSLASAANGQDTLLYIFDPLCGWCYGFSPVMEELAEQHAGDVHFEVVSGGMVLGERIGPIGEVAPYIKDAYKRVEQMTGVTFGESFLQDMLEKGEATFSSWEPSLALSAVKAEYPEQALAFSAALQKAIYRDGLPPTEAETFRKLSQDFGWPPEHLSELMQQESVAEATRADFKLSEELDVTGFPTVLFRHGEQWYVLTRGYTSLEQMEAGIQQIRNKE